MRKKEGMRQTDTKPLTRLITDEVEMINLHSTIWGTVQRAKSRRKLGAQFTAVNRERAKSRRKLMPHFTGVNREKAKSRRKLMPHFTGVNRERAKSRRKSGAQFTAVNRKKVTIRRNRTVGFSMRHKYRLPSPVYKIRMGNIHKKGRRPIWLPSASLTLN